MMDRKEALAQNILETEDPDQIAEITARIDQLEEQVSTIHRLLWFRSEFVVLRRDPEHCKYSRTSLLETLI